MKNTKNYNLQKPDFNNVADIDVLNSNFDITDKSLSVPYRATLKSGTTDTFIVTTGINKTELSDLFKITVVFPSATTTETKLVIDSCAPVKIVKAGNSNKKVKAKEVCNLVYSNSDSVFMCASGSCDDVSFTSDKLLEDSSANNSDGEKVNGTMPNIGQQTATINAGGKVTISKGYHDGTGYIQSNSMSTQLSNLGVTLTSASQLVKDVKAVDKNGTLLTGTATIQSLGGLITQNGSGTYTPTYTKTYNNKSVETMAITVPLNLSFTPKVLIISYEIYDYVGNKLITDVLNSYTNTWTKGVTNYSYGSSSSSTSYNHISTTKSISSMPKDSISITATNMNYANVWSFPYNGSVYHPNESDGFTPLPTNVSWTAIG